jgi:hypothetical protein
VRRKLIALKNQNGRLKKKLLFHCEKQMNSISINLFSIDLDSQPNGGLAENCVTAFKENQDDYSPSWYDRPCIENDAFGDVGHKFMCESDVPDQNKNRNPRVCIN